MNATLLNQLKNAQTHRQHQEALKAAKAAGYKVSTKLNAKLADLKAEVINLLTQKQSLKERMIDKFKDNRNAAVLILNIGRDVHFVFTQDVAWYVKCLYTANTGGYDLENLNVAIYYEIKNYTVRDFKFERWLLAFLSGNGGVEVTPQILRKFVQCGGEVYTEDSTQLIVKWQPASLKSLKATVIANKIPAYYKGISICAKP